MLWFSSAASLAKPSDTWFKPQKDCICLPSALSPVLLPAFMPAREHTLLLLQIYLSSLREQIPGRTKHGTLVLDEKAWWYLACVRVSVCAFLCAHMHVCVHRKKRGSNKCACVHIHVSRLLFERGSLICLWRLFLSVIYHWTCSLACVCVCVLYVIHHASLAWESTLSSASARHMLRSGRRASINRRLILSFSLISSHKEETGGTEKTAQARSSSAHTWIPQFPGVFQTRIQFNNISLKMARSNRNDSRALVCNCWRQQIVCLGTKLETGLCWISLEFPLKTSLISDTGSTSGFSQLVTQVLRDRNFLFKCFQSIFCLFPPFVSISNLFWIVAWSYLK